jgi:hypothetical protein
MEIKTLKKIQEELLNSMEKYKFYNNKYFDKFFGDGKTERLPLNIDHQKKEDIEIPTEIEDFCKKNNLKIINYKKGLVKPQNSKNIYKINHFIKDNELKKIFTNDINRAELSDTKVIFTRKHIDIINMSTNKNWNSCTNLYNKEKDIYEIPRMLISLIADSKVIIGYLVNNDDDEIINPHGRMYIYLSFNEKNNKELFYPSITTYGNFPKYIRKQVKTFIEENINKNTDEGEYYFCDTNKFYVYNNIESLIKNHKLIEKEKIKDKYKNIKLQFNNLGLYIKKEEEKIKITTNLEINKLDFGIESLKEYFDFPENHLENIFLDINTTFKNFKGLPEKISNLTIKKYGYINKKNKEEFSFGKDLKEIDNINDYITNENIYERPEYKDIYNFPIINRSINDSIGINNLKKLIEYDKLKFIKKTINI